MILTNKEKELISKEIENLEKFTSAELIAVITQKSSNYKSVMLMFSIVSVFLISFLLFFIKDDLYTLNQRIAAISPRENCDSAFLHRRLDRHEYFLKFDDGVGQTNLSLRDMEEFISFYPSRAEQIEIGIFFQNLDQSIALHEKKLGLTH